MRVKYDAEGDAAYIYLRKSLPARPNTRIRWNSRGRRT
ncbi:MAG: DUF2283 domain-containing protein [Actinobacteria bacterium]|nr:DUF2283 domain-containing protein [Actinomycetota bacterium]